MSTDVFDTKIGANVLGTATGFSAVTLSNTVDLPFTSRALYVGTGGNITVYAANSTTPVVFTNVGTGTILPVAVSRVLATGTTASNIVALY